MLSSNIIEPQLIVADLRRQASTNDQIKVPTIIQISNFKQRYIKKKNPQLLTFGEVLEYCEAHRQVPEDEDAPFIVSYQVRTDEDDPDNFPIEIEIPIEPERMRLFISTRRLLSQDFPDTIQADATYKLIWNNMPVLIIGFSDMRNVFHPYGLAVTSNETEHDFAFIFNSLQVGRERIYRERRCTTQ